MIRSNRISVYCDVSIYLRFTLVVFSFLLTSVFSSDLPSSVISPYVSTCLRLSQIRLIPISHVNGYKSSTETRFLYFRLLFHFYFRSSFVYVFSYPGGMLVDTQDA